MMKRTKMWILGMLLAMSVFALSACSRRGNNDQSQTGGNSPTTTQTSQERATGGTMETTQHTGNETRTNETGIHETGVDESSTGVIGGMINDVEQGVKNGIHDIERGVNDVMDGTRAPGQSETR